MMMERSKPDKAGQAAGAQKCLVNVWFLFLLESGRRGQLPLFLYPTQLRMSDCNQAGHSGFWNKSGTTPHRPQYLMTSTTPKNHGNWVP